MSFDKHASIFASAVFLDSAHKKSLSGENASIDLFIAGLYAKKGFSSSSNTSSPSSNGATQDLVRGLEQVLDKQKEHETQEKLNALNKVIANGIAETDTFIVSLDTESATTDMQEMFVSILFYFSMMCGSEKTLKTHKIGNVGGFEQPIRRNQARLIKALSDYDLPSIDGIKLEMSKFISILYQTYLLEDSRFMSPGTGIDYSKPIARVQVMPDTWHNLSRDYDGEELYPMTDDQVEEAYQLNLQRIKILSYSLKIISRLSTYCTMQVFLLKNCLRIFISI